ncbi:homeobox-leucine zipper protein HAT22-like [Solanum tuberosum]|uniref:Homeodomain leucine-zipper 1 n=1 Tax=Solanum tuberosum TaxID=4113 RepID=M1ANY1_SOLTU|nr:PREDICTED: homeobox-leucine zipper protein HAT22-like [Solanum tuberosum]KAH0699121.1 hypothetical protein KY284_013336 [Solanum tuberosum]
MDSTCDNIYSSAGLDLGLGFSSMGNQTSKKHGQVAAVKFDLGFEPSLNLSLSSGDHQMVDLKTENKDQLSVASSYSNGSVKRERDIGSEVTEVERVISCRVNHDEDYYEDDDASNGKKKLRLTKVQSALLEESFKKQSTLNPKQKQHLARKLNVRPRQVEVWFQNRRARTKLKQTEVDCEFLKKCCETLTDENRKLYKELQELKALKVGQPLYMKLPAAATLTVCPSCERAGAAQNSTKPHHRYGSFTNPSAAC